jgi:hypothetical protein
MADRKMREIARDIDFLLDHVDATESARLTEITDQLRTDMDPYLEDTPGPDPLAVLQRVEERREHVLEMAERSRNEGKNFTANQLQGEARMLYAILTGEKEKN